MFPLKAGTLTDTLFKPNPADIKQFIWHQKHTNVFISRGNNPVGSVEISGFIIPLRPSEVRGHLDLTPNSASSVRDSFSQSEEVGPFNTAFQLAAASPCDQTETCFSSTTTLHEQKHHFSFFCSCSSSWISAVQSWRQRNSEEAK